MHWPHGHTRRQHFNWRKFGGVGSGAVRPSANQSTKSESIITETHTAPRHRERAALRQAEGVAKQDRCAYVLVGPRGGLRRNKRSWARRWSHQRLIRGRGRRSVVDRCEAPRRRREAPFRDRVNGLHYRARSLCHALRYHIRSHDPDVQVMSRHHFIMIV